MITIKQLFHSAVGEKIQLGLLSFFFEVQLQSDPFLQQIDKQYTNIYAKI